MKRRRPKPEFAVEDMVYRLSRKFDYPDVSSRVASQRMDESQWGVFIHAGLTAAQTIPVNGDLLEWTGLELLGAAEEWNVVFPTTTLEIPTPGYYDIAVAFSWDTWESGGSVQVLRSLTAVWPPNADAVIGQWTYSLPSRSFHGVAKAVYCNAGDSISVFVDHEDSSTQDVAAAWITAELVDRVRAVVGQDLFIFLEDDTFDWHLAGQPETLSDVWIIGGGGAGAGNTGVSGWRGGGGGAGGLIHLTDYPVSGDCVVTVGLGGAGTGDQGSPGEDSSFDGEVAEGGGRGGIGTTDAGGVGAMDGGCGGGGTTAGAVTSGVGGNGGVGGSTGGDGGAAPNTAGPSGGGGGGIGANGTASSSSQIGGNGGVGIDLSSIVGIAYGDGGWFGGGGGGHASTTQGTGGLGGGGNAVTGNGEDALVNSGGGGGGGTTTGGDGGSGIVIVKVR